MIACLCAVRAWTRTIRRESAQLVLQPRALPLETTLTRATPPATIVLSVGVDLKYGPTCFQRMLSATKTAADQVLRLPALYSP